MKKGLALSLVLIASTAFAEPSLVDREKAEIALQSMIVHAHSSLNDIKEAKKILNDGLTAASLLEFCFTIGSLDVNTQNSRAPLSFGLTANFSLSNVIGEENDIALKNKVTFDLGSLIGNISSLRGEACSGELKLDNSPESQDSLARISETLEKIEQQHKEVSSILKKVSKTNFDAIIEHIKESRK